MSSPLPPLLLLDGGIGHLLKSKGVEQLVPGLKYDELFLAGALANAWAPEAVTAAHREYIAAGGCPAVCLLLGTSCPCCHRLCVALSAAACCCLLSPAHAATVAVGQLLVALHTRQLMPPPICPPSGLAGADVLTTNTFSCTEWSLGHISKADLQQELVEAAGQLAHAAANEASTAAAGGQASSGNGSGSASGRQVLVAGSLPPLQESYQASGLQAFEEMQPQYHLLAGLLKPHCDLLLCETLATVTEGLAAASAASASGLPFWVSWTIGDSGDRSLLRSGEPLQASGRGPASGSRWIACTTMKAGGATGRARS